MARRQHLALAVILAFVLFFSISYLFSSETGTDDHVALKGGSPAGSDKGFTVDFDALPVGILEGESIAPKLENATLK